VQDSPGGAGGFEAQVDNFPIGARAGAVALNGAKRFSQAAIQTVRAAWTAGGLTGETVEGDDASAARDQIDQPLECGFNGIEIFIDVGMIELDRGENDGVGKVVQEFRALVEECGVVLIAFEDEVFAITKMKTRTEIFGDASDQERRLQSGGVENPGKHGCGGRLPMSSGDDQHFFAPQEFVVEQLRQRTEWDALVEQVLEFDIAARHSIADHNEIRAGFEILGVEGLRHGNIQLAQKLGHGGVGSGVGAGHSKSALLQHSGQRGHGGAANADEVNVFLVVHIRNQ